jgi:hypothetical protein
MSENLVASVTSSSICRNKSSSSSSSAETIDRSVPVLSYSYHYTVTSSPFLFCCSLRQFSTLSLSNICAAQVKETEDTILLDSIIQCSMTGDVHKLRLYGRQGVKVVDATPLRTATLGGKLEVCGDHIATLPRPSCYSFANHLAILLLPYSCPMDIMLPPTPKICCFSVA